MTITVLSENTASSETFGSEHGLSLYVETEKHRLVFDTGAGALFAENADKLGVSLVAADIAVLSHGHYDHGGGLETFLELNDHAPVYVHARAFEPHYADRPGGMRAYIGLDPALLPNPRFVFCAGHTELDGELSLFSEVEAETPVPAGNAELYRRAGDALMPDDFAHEQDLVVRQGEKTVLFAGCAHRGILNIVRQFRQDTGRYPDVVVGGFHLHSRGTGRGEAPEAVDALAQALLETGAQYYTCHCTGAAAYMRLRDTMGARIGYLSAGSRLRVAL